MRWGERGREVGVGEAGGEETWGGEVGYFGKEGMATKVTWEG